MFNFSLNKSVAKPVFYDDVLLLLQGILHGEKDVLANLANTASFLYHCLPEVNWVGFYRAAGNELVLGPFHGKPACIRIPRKKGVCGVAFAEKCTQLVVDVEAFPGHIACDADSKSEIVLPLIIDDRVVAVLDIDSPVIGRFDQEDKTGLEAITHYLCNTLDKHNAFWQIT